MPKHLEPFEVDDALPTEEAPNIDTDLMMSSLIVGSGLTSDIVIGHHSVSPEHIRITQMGNGMYRIVDLGSEGGTFVDGYRKNHFFVNFHDAIQIGQHPLEIQWLASHFDGVMLQETEECSTVEISACLIIGRELPADVVIPYPVISPKHAEIRLDIDGMLIRDLDSEFGTLVNGKRIDNWVHLGIRDKLTLGNYHVPQRALFRWRNSLQQSELVDSPQTSISSPIPEKGLLLIGRDSKCDIVVDHPTVSWHHAQLIVDGDKREIIDLDSANGTFVDGRPVSRSLIGSENNVRVGTVNLHISNERVSESKRARYDIRLDAENVSRQIGDDVSLLSDISLSIYPGEMIALMGPSGAGKTTLLEILSGRQRASSGEVRLNGKELYKCWSEHHHNIGFVPQEDIMHRDLTVFEVLYYAAKLRLPSDLPEETIVKTVERLLTRMGLVHIRSSIIGDETVRGISGGQRKRVNIAIELITEPALLFLDEPTSGLDATSTLEVLRILRALADSGKTIIMTIHQPRYEAYEMMDGLILLASGGHLAYYGPTNKGAVDYFEEQSSTLKREGGNPADFVLDALESRLVNQSPEDWARAYRDSLFYTQYVTQRLGKQFENVEVHNKSLQRPMLQQFLILFQRYTKRKLRDRTSLVIQLSQAPVISCLLGLLFWMQGEELVGLDIHPKLEKIPSLVSALQLQSGVHPTLFLIGAASFWLGCSNVARELVSDRSIFVRERRTSIRTSSYLGAIFGFQLILCMVQTFIIATVVWSFTSLSANFFAGWFVLLLTAASGISLGLLISALSATEVTAISLVPLLLLPQLMLGGYVKLFGLMEESLYSWQSYLASLMPIRWSFEAVAILEYNAALHQNPNLRELVEVIGFTYDTILFPCAVILATILLCFYGTWFQLKQSTK